jgi:CrcB protein
MSRPDHFIDTGFWERCMHQLIAIALGGSAGAVVRFLVANGIYGWLGRDFPYGTLFVNVSGSFLMGLLTELMLQRFAVAAEYRAAVLVGFLGAYTTFSTFALETLTLFDQGGMLKGFLNILLSVMLCLIAVWVGLIWGRSLFTGADWPWAGQGHGYIALGIAWGVAFGSVLLAAIIFQWFETPIEQRAILMIVLLGTTTIASTLWMAFKLTDARLDWAGLFTLFILNGLCGGAVFWLGNHLGNWLWQLNLSR